MLLNDPTQSGEPHGRLSDVQSPKRKTIRVLPKELAEKIAAGEVVERPGSVVKELIENSLDADAKSIRVDIEDGGRKRLRVLDDGHGIANDELLMALERHATSKINELDDLWNLHTMGFRGEALPSIAAVSRFTLESKTLSQNGRKVYLEGGKLVRDESLPAQSQVQLSGTCITVEDIFYNVPARLKFMKSRSAETSVIRELIERIALCNPHVGFSFYSDSRKSLQLQAVSDPAVRVAAILETKLENIEYFDSQFESISVRGWLDRDSRATNSRGVYLSVNGRMVRDKLLQQAVLVGLRPRMMEGEYPKIYLAVDVPPNEVDVNVHPAKSEVRFQKSKDVFQVVHGALSKLAKTSSKAFYSTKLPESQTTQTEEETIPEATVSAMETLTARAAEQEHHREENHASFSPELFSGDRVSYKTKTFPDRQQDEARQTSNASDSQVFARPETSSQPVYKTTSPGFTKLHYIGQLKNTYLLFQDEDGLVMIDQHAAHERVNYERIKADLIENGLKPQPLLVSIAYKCKPEDVALALDHIEAFIKLGFEFEAFGENSLLIRTIPEGIEATRASELFKALLSELRDSEVADLVVQDPSRLSAKLERVIATAACHGSIRAGQSLSSHEAKKLAAQMEQTESSLNCPHGRPASIKLTFSQIEGLFKRG